MSVWNVKVCVCILSRTTTMPILYDDDESSAEGVAAAEEVGGVITDSRRGGRMQVAGMPRRKNKGKNGKKPLELEVDGHKIKIGGGGGGKKGRSHSRESHKSGTSQKSRTSQRSRKGGGKRVHRNKTVLGAQMDLLVAGMNRVVTSSQSQGSDIMYFEFSDDPAKMPLAECQEKYSEENVLSVVKKALYTGALSGFYRIENGMLIRRWSGTNKGRVVNITSKTTEKTITVQKRVRADKDVLKGLKGEERTAYFKTLPHEDHQITKMHTVVTIQIMANPQVMPQRA